MGRCRLPGVFACHGAAACRPRRMRFGDTTRTQAIPSYGDAQYKTDLAQCRKQNSKIVIVGGYDDKGEVQVDEDKARSCMNERGWQAVSR